jgi:predicted restriction endonuclease
VLKVCHTHGLWEPPPRRCPQCQREKDERRRALGTTGWGDGRDRSAQAKFRREVIALYGMRCGAIHNGVRCTATTDLQAHHTQPGNNDPTTGVMLCREHHRIVDKHAR